MAFKGDAAFRYDAGQGQVTVNLRRPLWRPKPGVAQIKSRISALDLKSVTVITYADELPLISGFLRMIDNPTEILELIRVGQLGVPLEYFPSLSGGTFATCLLTAPLEDVTELEFEPTHMSYGYYQQGISLLRTDGGDWSLLPGTNL